MIQDLRFALRRLASRPPFTGLMVLILALGIGATTAVFTIVDQTLFRLPPFTNADRLVQVIHIDRPRGGGSNTLSPEKIFGWQMQAAIFERFEGYAPQPYEITGSGEPERGTGYLVTTNLFEMLGARPQLGRGFAPPDGQAGAPAVVVISDGMWRRRYGADRAVIGRTIDLNGEPHTIVGVMPRRFTLSQSAVEALWLPADVTAAGNSGGLRRFFGLGWIPSAVAIETVQARTDQIAEQMQRSAPLAEGWYVRVMPRTAAFVDANARSALFLLLGAVALVLLITCANVANLFLVRATARAREIAVRAALGASRPRLMREVITESVVLAVAGGIMGVLIARWGIDAAFAVAPSSMYFLSPDRIAIDQRVLAVTLAATLATGVLFGLIPAIRATSPMRDTWLRGTRTDGGRSTGRLSGGIAVVEMAIALVLLVGAALMARTFVNLHAIDPGFDPRGVVTAEVALPSDRYPTETVRNVFFNELARGLEGAPGIQGVAFGRNSVSGAFSITWAVQSEDGGPMTDLVGMNDVSGSYFQTLRIPFLAGRPFDGMAPDTVVVSRSLASRLWPGRTALGRRLRVGERSPWWTVVGVVSDVENRMLQLGPVTDQRVSMFLYIPFADRVAAPPPRTPARRVFVPRVLMVRATDPGAAIALIKARVAALDPAQPVERVALAEDTYADLFDRQRFVLVLMSAFSVLALVLAAAGIFAVMSQAVAQRTREIGVRVALGATSRDIFQMILSRGLALAAIGTAAGIAGALAVSRLLTSLLYGVSPADPISYAAVAAVLLTVAFAACWVPTRRAVRIEPAIALRVE